MFFFISLYMQQVLGYDALKAGLSYLPLAVGIIVSAGVGVAARDALRLQAGADLGPGADRGRPAVVRAGARRTAATSATSCSRRCSRRVGLGFAFVPVTIAAVSGVEHDEAGLASGLINTSQQIGGALGLAILATIANTRTDDVMAGRRRPRRCRSR